MNNSDYTKYIENLIPSTFVNILVFDVMADLVLEYAFENDQFVCKNTIPFTSFYNELENIIHPDDIKGYIDNISINILEEKQKQGFDQVRYDYRKKGDNDKYDWYSNVTKLLKVDNKNLALVLVESSNGNVKVEDDNPETVEKLKARQKIIFDTISGAIINLNGVVNINRDTDNPEIKSITTYFDNILMDLTNSFPEISQKLADNMIDSTNQGSVKTILIVDDDKMTCSLLEKTFKDTYKIIIANDGQTAIDVLKENGDSTNLKKKDKIVGMFLDLNMPGVDGFGVLDYMSSKNLLSKMPVIIISGDYNQEIRDRAYIYPIADVLEKPFNVQVVKHRIKTLIKLYKSNNSLNEMVLTQHQEIKNVLRTLVKSYLYDYSSDIKSITKYFNMLVKQVSDDYEEFKFDDMRLEKVTEAIMYYNIGLYCLPHNMIEKKEFNDDEMKIIKSHPYIGLSIFNSVLYRDTDRIFNHYAKDIIEYHEENYDGTGYPLGVKENNIPVAAQIARVAIEYNNLIKEMTSEEAISLIIKESGKKFNPKIIDSFEKIKDQLK